MNSFPTNSYYLKVTSYILWQSIKPVTVVKLDQICQIFAPDIFDPFMLQVKLRDI